MNRITAIAIVGAAAVLAGCGGGGGGGGSGGGSSGVSYSGSTKAAVINSDASAAQVGSTVYGSNRGAGRTLQSGSASPYELLQLVTSHTLTLAANQGRAAAVAGVAVNETVKGNCGGSATMTGDATRDTAYQLLAPSNVTVTYSSYCFTDSTGEQRTTSGSVQIVVASTATGSTTKFTSSSMSITTSSGTMIHNGSYTYYLDLNRALTRMEYVYDYQHFDGKVYRAGDTTAPVTFTFDTSFNLTEVSGLFCDPNVDGCVTASTPTPLGYAAGCVSGKPDSGMIKLSGGNGAGGQATYVTISPQADCTNVNICWGEGTTDTNCTLTPWSQF